MISYLARKEVLMVSLYSAVTPFFCRWITDSWVAFLVFFFPRPPTGFLLWPLTFMRRLVTESYIVIIFSSIGL